jgi:chromosomal replication initiator protein
MFPWTGVALTHEAVWQHVLEHIRRNITEVEYHTWFERIRPLGIREGVLELAVPTSFALDWIKRHYAPLIQEALGLLGAQVPRFELLVVPGAAQPVQVDIFQAAPQADQGKSKLNPKYTFENFVVGPNNNLAHAAAVAVAESPGKAYNPLFIYGG